jgi:hypothetical protein
VPVGVVNGGDVGGSGGGLARGKVEELGEFIHKDENIIIASG